MFQFPGFAFLAEFGAFGAKGCPIRISTDHVLFADPRSFSQLITSFFASESLGILHTLFLTSIYKLSSALRLPSPRLTLPMCSFLISSFRSSQPCSQNSLPLSLYSFFSMSMNFLSVFSAQHLIWTALQSFDLSHPTTMVISIRLTGIQYQSKPLPLSFLPKSNSFVQLSYSLPLTTHPLPLFRAHRSPSTGSPPLWRITDSNR